MSLGVGQGYCLAMERELVKQPIGKDVLPVEGHLVFAATADEAMVAVADVPNEAFDTAEQETTVGAKYGLFG